MNPLPFELDGPELLEAAARALAAAVPFPARTGQESRPRAESAPVYALWQRAPYEGAAIRGMPDSLPEEETVFSRLDLASVSAGMSAEALSREIERDARRFEAN